MGNDHSKNGSGKYGQIFLQTDKSAYLGGETVTGKVYLNLLIPYPGNQLFLKLKGREVVKIVRTTQEQYVDEKDATIKYREKHELFRDKHDTIKMNVPIYTWGNLMPGQYQIPFAFMLPSHLASSFHQQGNRYLANVSYQLEAILEPALKSDFKLKYKQPFVVRQPVTNAASGQVQEVNTQISACCSSKGSNILRVNFEKNYYAPGEVAQVYMQLDNALATTDNTKICLALKQRLSMNAGLVSETREFVKVVRDLPGLRAGQTGTGNYIAINLPAFQGTDYREIKHFVAETLAMASEEGNFLNPATRGKLVKSEYFLEVSCPMDGCCATCPAISLPIEIYYPEIRLQAVSTPPNWQPQLVDSINVSFGGAAPQQGYNIQQTGFQQNQGIQQTGFQQNQGGYNNNYGQNQGGYNPPQQYGGGIQQTGFQ